MFNDLREFVSQLEKAGELIRIKEPLSPRHEIGATIKAFDKTTGSAVFFEAVTGYQTPVVGNILSTRKKLALALGTNRDVVEEYLRRSQTPIKPKVVKKAPVKEVIIGSNINILRAMPVLIHHQKDVDPYLTSAVTIAKDPETGIRGMGIHRVQIKDRNTVGIFLGTPPLSEFLRKAEERDQPLEIAIAVGMDPITWFSSVIWAPKGIDKFDIAGGLARKAIRLVRCESVDVEVPATAEFVLEGKVLPHVRKREGPFGESTGYYFTYDNPVAKIDVITHRKDPVYHALMTWTSEESVLVGVSWEAENLRAVQKVFPFVRAIRLTPSSLGAHAVVQIEKRSEQDGRQVADHLLSDHHVKMVIVVDTDVDCSDLGEVEWALATRFQADKDTVIKTGMRGSAIDPSTGAGRMTAKLGLDATKTLGEDAKFEKIALPSQVSRKVQRIISAYLD